MTVKDLVNIINLDSTLALEVNKLIECKYKKIKALSHKCVKDFNVLAPKSDLMRLAVCLNYAAEFTYPEYKNRGIDDKIFCDTMQDITIWCKNNSNMGLGNYRWIKNHLNCELFRIGRLQYQLFKCTNNTLNYSKLPFNYGDNLIYVHIPQGEKLIYSDCVASLLSAKEFLEKYFPEFQYNFFFSESWLLYDKNREFMSSSSNIIQFQSLFSIAYSCNDQSQAIERIFGKMQIDKSKYPENTSLQKSSKKYILSGKKLGVGIGIINKNDLAES